MIEDAVMPEKKGVKIKLLRTAGFYNNKSNPLDHPFFPPLALGILFAQLSNHGYDVSQDDLSIRAHHNIFVKDSDAQLKYELFLQEERIKRYVKSGLDDELEREIEKILKDVNINGTDIFLLSMPESPANASNILFVMSFSKFLKKKYSSPIALGGDIIAITLLKDKYDVSGIIDYIVVGDGEEVVIDLVDKIIHEKDSRKSDEVTIIQSPGKKKIVIPDFSGLPLEKYKLNFLDYKHFYSNEFLKDFFSSDASILLFSFVNGCGGRCAFCGASGGSLGAVLEPEEVVDGFKLLQEKFNPTGYLILNDTINISRSYIEKICDLICKNNINILWSACARVNGLDEEIIAKMRKAGCVRLILGMETASSGLLKKVNKGITIVELENVLKLTSKYGIWTGVELISGLPHETEEDINTTINFLVNNKEYIDIVYQNIFDLRDHSLMFLHPKDYGLENIRELNLYKSPGADNFNMGNIVRYSFDETDGLKWEDKKKQMVSSYQKVARAINGAPVYPQFMEEHVLFYLYSRFNDKQKVKKYYAESVECLY